MEMSRQLHAAAVLRSVNTPSWGLDSSVGIATHYGLDGP
jgi:hypothetical protein